ncbi:uncharacterized protein LOC111361555 [Spodoptera litura]|uniref:Uncharacterized protein LOC111361555 n=1 Tax=Spodoptera litura TaxID=69820 RepID=A0A9J7J1R6_SPOLT|nr:uncharacterized protein LOC111361555 [Spodoptera litura]
MKVCACVLLFTIFALIKTSSQDTNKDIKVKKAIEGKPHTKEERTLNIAKDLLAKTKTLGKVPKFQVTTPRVVTFTGFILQAINIINTYEDTTFGDFIDILNEEVKNYHYRGCKFSELTKHHDTRRMLQTKLNLISGKPVSETKANINAVADILRDERYDKKVKDFVDYINSLYGPETVEKFEKILNELQYYNKPKTRRLDDNMAQVIKDALKALIFDYYTHLHVNAKIELKERIQNIWNQMKGTQTSTFNTRQFNVSPPTTNFYISGTEDKESSNDLEEVTGVEARANKNENTDPESEKVLDSSSNSIEQFQEKLREFNTHRYVTLVTEGFDEVHSNDETDEANQIGNNNEPNHKNKPQSSDENSKYVKGLARYAMKHLNNHDINKVYEMATGEKKHKSKDKKKYREKKQQYSIEEDEDNIGMTPRDNDKYYEAKNKNGLGKHFSGSDTFGYKRAFHPGLWRGGRYTQIYRRGGSSNTTTAANVNDDLERRVSNLEKQVQEVRKEMIVGHKEDRNNNKDSVTIKSKYDTNNKLDGKTALTTVQMRAKAKNNNAKEVTAREPLVIIRNRAVDEETSTAYTRVYDNGHGTTVYDKINASMTTSTNLRRRNSPITHPAADYTYIELDPFDHIHDD